MRGKSQEVDRDNARGSGKPACLLEPLEPRWLLSVALPHAGSVNSAAVVSSAHVQSQKAKATTAGQVALSQQNIDVSTAAAVGEAQLVGSALPRPTVLTWPLDWTAVYGIDNGGPASTAKANQILDRYKSLGIAYVSINNIPAANSWLEPLIKAKGLLTVLEWSWSSIVVAPAGTPDTTNVGGTYVRNEVMHTDYDGSSTSWQCVVCPNYRGSIFTQYFAGFNQAVQATQPDFVVIDSEIFSVPATDSPNSELSRCKRCRNIAGYMQGLQEWVDDHIAIVHATNPNAGTIFFRGWNAGSHTSDQLWRGGGAYFTSGDYPSPGMYSPVQYDNLDAFKSVIGNLGYPWLYLDNPATGDMNLAKFQSIVKGLKDRGAAGTALFMGGDWYGKDTSDAFNEQIWSYIASAQSIIAGVPVPAAPTGLAAKVVSSSRIDLSWIAATKAAGFRIEQSLDGTNWTVAGTIDQPGTTTYAVTGLAPNARYYFRVAAYNASGDSPFSNIATRAILPGDATGDGKVNFSDYLVIEVNFGKSGGYSQGDFNGDGMVTFSDYLTLESNYGRTL